jgi:hypothetical protein
VLPKPQGAALVYENDLGEFETRLLLFQSLQDVGAASRGAAGWAGDRYDVVNTPQGAGLTWLTVWESVVDAIEFRDLMERTIERRFGTPAGGGGRGNARRFTAKGRAIELVLATVRGQPAVLFTDVPAGANTKLIDLDQVRLEKP